MNKSELVQALALTLTDNGRATSKAAADETLTALAQVLTTALKNGDEIVLPGLGKFSTSHSPERQGRNPQTGAALTIAARTNVKFSATKVLKDALNT